MGRVFTFDLKALRAEYGLDMYVETGFGLGDSLQAADHAGFKLMLACDIDSEAAKITRRRHFETPTRLLTTTSERFFRDVRFNAPALYWLDAHYPGEMTHRYAADNATTWPLARELTMLYILNDMSRSVIICDDARLYWDMPFENGNMLRPAGAEPIEVALKLYEATHTQEIDLRHEGYIVLKPRQKSTNAQENSCRLAEESRPKTLDENKK